MKNSDQLNTKLLRLVLGVGLAVSAASSDAMESPSAKSIAVPGGAVVMQVPASLEVNTSSYEDEAAYIFQCDGNQLGRARAAKKVEFWTGAPKAIECKRIRINGLLAQFLEWDDRDKKHYYEVLFIYTDGTATQRYLSMFFGCSNAREKELARQVIWSISPKKPENTFVPETPTSTSSRHAVQTRSTKPAEVFAGVTFEVPTEVQVQHRDLKMDFDVYDFLLGKKQLMGVYVGNYPEFWKGPKTLECKLISMNGTPAQMLEWDEQPHLHCSEALFVLSSDMGPQYVHVWYNRLSDEEQQMANMIIRSFKVSQKAGKQPSPHR